MNKGRSKKLISMRNEALFHRFEFLTEVKNLNFEQTLRQLSEQEFYLSEHRIMDILRNKKKK